MVSRFVTRWARPFLVTSLLITLALSASLPTAAEGSGPFTDLSNLGLPGVSHSSMAWGDYDGDGDMDVIIAGLMPTPAGPSVPISRIYRNDGNLGFTDVQAGLRGVLDGSVAWGDYDNDGDLDVLLCGASATDYYDPAGTTRIYRNDGSSVFTDIQASLPGVNSGSVAWGDYDRDGDLDILLCGWTGTGSLAAIYRNDGNGVFTGIGAQLKGSYSADWGDYDHDGDLDILTTGYEGGTGPYTKIYRNDGGSFVDSGANLPGIFDNSVVWGDYDADGDLDILLTGLDMSMTPISRVYRNDNGDFVDTNAGLMGVENGAAAWGDYDRDGDLDILLSGYCWGGPQIVTKVYHHNGDGSFTDIDAALPGIEYGCVAWADYDGDGHLDIALAGSAALRVFTRLYRNNGDGTFACLRGAYGSLAWGDYDGDGDLDLLVAGYGPPWPTSMIYRNDGSGIFTDIHAGLPGASGGRGVWGDYDGDGDLDLLLVGNGISRVYRNDGDGRFTDINAGLQPIATGAAAWGDYDNDGDLDILLAGYMPSGPTSLNVTRIYRNEGDGTFADINAALPLFSSGSAAWGDYDNDGDLDILIAGMLRTGIVDWTYASKVLRNDGNGVFTDVDAGLPGILGAVAWGDYDSDGDLDILLAGGLESYGFIARVYRNDGGTFTDANAGLPGFGSATAAWGDYDNDGDLDILLAGWIGGDTSSSVLRVYRNDGNGAFTDLGVVDMLGSSAAWGDIDGDGDLDIVASVSYDGSAPVLTFYRNKALTANTPPSAPSGLAATVVGSTVNLSWNAAGDAQTPAPGLTYNLRVGTAPGMGDVAAPMADGATGRRLLPEMGNLNHGTTARLENLPAGTYYWSVQAVDAAWAGSPFSDESSFTVAAAPPSQVAIAGPAVGRINAASTFTATVNPRAVVLPLTYTWQAAGQAPVTHTADRNTDSIAYTWPITGTKTITVTASSAGVTVTATHTIGIFVPPQADFTATPITGTAPLTVTFTNTSTGDYTSVLWSFGDYYYSSLPNPTHTYRPGKYTVSLTVSGPAGKATQTKIDYITVASGLQADFTATPITGIAPLTVAFSNSSIGSYNYIYWDFGDWGTSSETNPTHTYQYAGVFDVSLTVAGPYETAHKLKAGYITVYAPVEARFSAAPTAGVAPLAVAFENSSSGDYTSVLWDFGDGQTSTESSPTHIYAAKGVYTVTVTVSGPGGTATRTSPSYITVYAPAKAAFTATPLAGLPPLAVAFTNASTGDYDTALWIFGDGSTSTVPSPTHTYNALGTYTVTLTVSGPGGTSSEARPGYIWVCTRPKARFKVTPSDGAAPLSVAFSNLSTGGFTESLWDFGDGTTSTEANPTHVYVEPGHYTVTLTVSGPGGTATESEKNCVMVLKKPD